MSLKLQFLSSFIDEEILAASAMDEISVNDLQDKPEGLDVSVLSTDSVSGLPVAPHPYG